MKNKKLVALLGGIFLLLVVGYLIVNPGLLNVWPGEVKIDENAYYPVSHVVDGDTFDASVDGHDIRIRVLGINTPETVDPRKPVECYGPEASAAAKELLDGRKVMLKYNPNREKRDKYGRYLLYAYRDDGLFVNEYMIQEGFAREYTFGTAYSMQKEFRKAENAAKREEKGLWVKCTMP